MIYFKNKHFTIQYSDISNENQGTLLDEDIPKDWQYLKLSDKIQKCDGKEVAFVHYPCQTFFVQDGYFNCRDMFHQYFDKTTKFFHFGVNPYGAVTAKLDHYKNIARRTNGMIEFIHEVESRLGVDGRTKFEKSMFANVVKIIPAKFWINYYLRMSLFSIFVRYGQEYNGENFDNILSYPYLNHTKSALDLFLAGKTRVGRLLDYKYRWTHSSNGWHAKFNDDKNLKLLRK